MKAPKTSTSTITTPTLGNANIPATTSRGAWDNKLLLCHGFVELHQNLLLILFGRGMTKGYSNTIRVGSKRAHDKAFGGGDLGGSGKEEVHVGIPELGQEGQRGNPSPPQLCYGDRKTLHLERPSLS